MGKLVMIYQKAYRMPQFTNSRTRTGYSVADAVDEDDGDELCTMRQVVSLRCPVSLTRMAVPVRGPLCKHPQCFDREFFLVCVKKQRQATPYHKCPICQTIITSLEDLVIDEKLLAIIKATAKPLTEDPVLQVCVCVVLCAECTLSCKFDRKRTEMR